MPMQLVHFFLSPFLCIGINTLVCHFFGSSSVFQALDTHKSANETQSCSWLLTFRVEYHLQQVPCQLLKILLLCSPPLRLDKFLHQFIPWMFSNVGLLLNLRAHISIFSNDLGCLLMF